MTDLAAISAQVVDIQNDRQHKGFIKITVHVPEEGSDLVSKAFGIPSYTRPVPVVLARLNVEENPAQPPPASPNIDKEGARRLYARVGLMCRDPLFHRYLEDIYQSKYTEEDAANHVRSFCDVVSRKEIVPESGAAKLFERMEDDFELWKAAPDLARRG